MAPYRNFVKLVKILKFFSVFVLFVIYFRDTSDWIKILNSTFQIVKPVFPQTIGSSIISSKKELKYPTRAHILILIIWMKIINELCFFVKATLCITTTLIHCTASHFQGNPCTSLWRTRFAGWAVAFY